MPTLPTVPTAPTVPTVPTIPAPQLAGVPVPTGAPTNTPVAPIPQQPVQPMQVQPQQAQQAQAQQAQYTGPYGQLAGLAGQQFGFDFQGAVQQAQKDVAPIYQPQQAQLDVLREMGNIRAEDTRVQTQKDFDTRMQKEVEAINRRGAFFSGGAIRKEQDIRESQDRAMRQVNLSSMAQDLDLLTQKGVLGAQEAQAVMQRASESESSAYNRWRDTRDFTFKVDSEIDKRVRDDRDYSRQVFESDRGFEFDVKKFKSYYELDKKKFGLMKDKFKFDKKKYGDQYALSQARYSASQSKAGKRGVSYSDEETMGILYTIMGTEKGATRSKDSVAQIAHSKYHMQLYPGSVADSHLNYFYDKEHKSFPTVFEGQEKFEIGQYKPTKKSKKEDDDLAW